MKKFEAYDDFRNDVIGEKPKKRDTILDLRVFVVCLCLFLDLLWTYS